MQVDEEDAAAAGSEHDAAIHRLKRGGPDPNELSSPLGTELLHRKVSNQNNTPPSVSAPEPSVAIEVADLGMEDQMDAARLTSPL